MFRTIFRKQFITYLSALTLCFTALGISLAGLFQSYFINQKTEVMKTQGQRIATAFVRTYVVGTIWDMMRPDNTFQNELETINKYLDVNCFFCIITEDGDKLRNIYAAGVSGIQSGQIIDFKELTPVLSGEIIRVTGTLNNTFDENMLIVGYPVLYNNAIYGAVFMSAPMREVHDTIGDVVRIVIICLIAAASVSFVLIYISSKTISKPIHQINEVAKVIAGGDFAKRLDVKSRDEVGQLAESFNNMAESLENQENNRRAFVADISHDLRSPLTSIRGFIQAMLDGVVPADSHDKYLKIVLTETERLAKLANDVMYIGQFQNFGVLLDITRFDINELIRKTALMFEQRVTEKSINMSVTLADERTVVDADAEKIHRVLYNLIDNAIKFVNDGGQVAIETFTDAKCERVYVCVKDDGPGISPEDQKKIFERFYKADKSRGQDKTGSGLGLTIVREFVLAHGEGISVNSTPGEGSEFVFGLRIAGAD